jgi:hypothetical protein
MLTTLQYDNAIYSHFANVATNKGIVEQPEKLNYDIQTLKRIVNTNNVTFLSTSAYSRSKLYLLKNNANYTVTYSRTSASGDTRINSDGNVEYFPYNLCSGTLVAIAATTITTNYSTSPINVNDATRIVTTGYGITQISFTPVLTKTYTVSMWVKSNTASTYQIQTLAGTIINTADSNWKRISFISTGNSDIRFVIPTASDVSVWGVQINEGTIMMPYINADNSQHIPRINYTNNKSAIRILPQRTNLILNSDTPSTQTITVTASTYTLSFYGTGTITLSNAFSATVVGDGVNTRKVFTFTSTGTSLVLTITGTVTKAQLELSNYPTNYIGSTTTANTRTGDYFIKVNMITDGIVGSSTGSMFMHIINNTSLIRQGSLFPILGLSTGANATGNGIFVSGGVSNTTSSRLIISVENATHTTTADEVKLLVTWANSSISVFENGVKVINNSSVTTTNFQYFGTTSPPQHPLDIHGLWFLPSTLTDSECISLTQL